MTKPKVTIAIASYNMASYLPQALDSALMQDYPDIEVLVVDDGSTDNTPDVVAGYSGRVRYIRQENSGVANAYNRLLQEAAGDYVHHLDADDVLRDGAIRRLARLLDDNPSVGLAYGAALVMDADGNVYGKRTAPAPLAGMGVIPSRIGFRELLRGCHITTSTVMLRKTVLDRVALFQQEAVPGEDWDMWMRVAAEYDLAYCAEPVAYYRIHGTSITSAYTVESVLRSHIFSLGRIFDDESFRYRNQRGFAYACLNRTIAAVAARSRKRLRFARWLLSAIRRHPPMLFERETAAVILEGAKTLLPVPLIAAARRIRRSGNPKLEPVHE